MAYTRRLPISEIKNEITSATVEFAEDFGKYLGTTDIKDSVNPKNNKRISNKYTMLTTSQLRKFFGEVKRQEMVGYHATDFILLKPKLAYAVGRSDKNSKIKDFYEVLSEMIDQVSNEQEFRRFIKIFEAIVAYHKVVENENKR